MLTSLISLSYTVVIKHSIILYPINLYNKAYVTRKNKYLHGGGGPSLTQNCSSSLLILPHHHNHIASVLSHILVNHFIISDVFGCKPQNANSTVMCGLTLKENLQTRGSMVDSKLNIFRTLDWCLTRDSGPCL